MPYIPKFSWTSLKDMEEQTKSLIKKTQDAGHPNWMDALARNLLFDAFVWQSQYIARSPTAPAPVVVVQAPGPAPAAKRTRKK